MENLIDEDASQFWNIIKNNRRNDQDIPNLMSWNTRKADNGEEISNLFASFFKSIYENNQCNKVSIK